MLGFAAPRQPRKSDEGERPFWISYADLMTALMALFLVVMVASLISLTKKIRGDAEAEENRRIDIATLCQSLKSKAQKIDTNITVDCKDNRINFGEAGKFGRNDYRLRNEGKDALQKMVPIVLDAAESKIGKRWFKQVLIEGFTDTDGSYLYNLHLSLQRSEWVMCSLLDTRSVDKTKLQDEQKKLVRDLFLAGGVSFNNPKKSKDASRRVELRMQFYGLKEDQQAQEQPEFHITKDEVCQLN